MEKENFNKCVFDIEFTLREFRYGIVGCWLNSMTPFYRNVVLFRFNYLNKFNSLNNNYLNKFNNLKKNKVSAPSYTPTLRQNKLKNANACRIHVPIRNLPIPDS